MIILFADFDGVLHPQPTSDEDLFCRAPLLWKILRACPTVEIVFSTSWRHMCGFDELVALVTAGGGEEFVGRFIGATPSILREQGANISGPIYRRHMECRLWIEGNNHPSKSWLALDDDAREFPAYSANLYYTDKATGLTELDVALVIDQVRSMSLSWLV